MNFFRTLNARQHSILVLMTATLLMATNLNDAGPIEVKTTNLPIPTSIISPQECSIDLDNEIKDRDILSALKTSFVPVLPSTILYRQKREVNMQQEPHDMVFWNTDISNFNLSNPLWTTGYDWSETEGENHDSDLDTWPEDPVVPQETIWTDSEVNAPEKWLPDSLTFGDGLRDPDSLPEDAGDNAGEGIGEGGMDFISSDDLEISEVISSDDEDNDGEDKRGIWGREEIATLEEVRDAQAKLMSRYMDKNANPCNDFYQFACGNWGSENPIPPDKAGYDTFEKLRDDLDAVLRGLLETPPGGPNDTEATVKAKYLYQSCMNDTILENRRETPLLDLLRILGGWPVIEEHWDSSKFDWVELMGQLRLFNNDILVSQWVGPDIMNSDEYVIQFDQTSLGLPSRDYFLSPANSEYLSAYRDYLAQIATLLGADPERAQRDADIIIHFETELAKITTPPDDRRNVSSIYRRVALEQLEEMVPHINWHDYLTIVLGKQPNSTTPVVVFAFPYLERLVDLIDSTQPETVANYLLWRFVRHRVNNLDTRFQESKQAFYLALFGREEQPPRWKNCIAQVNSNMGMAVGAMFVRRFFDENSKEDTLLMTKELQAAFTDLLNQTEWIDGQTKELAAEKVQEMVLRIGYPDFILDPNQLNLRYKELQITPNHYFENTLNVLRHLTRVEQGRLGTPVNKSLWNTAPAVVNAYYSRNKNQIMFPAGILQPPFYHRYYPRCLNYGGIGVVIGHEITHGFDDKGRLFDKRGNLHRWWSPEAVEGFHQRAQCLIEQYSNYTVEEVMMQINGLNTQGENIADNGGIKQAFTAYKKWRDLNKNTNETLPSLDLTPEQLFFLNFAQVWCGAMRPEATRNKLKTAVHSPGKYR